MIPAQQKEAHNNNSPHPNERPKPCIFRRERERDLLTKKNWKPTVFQQRAFFARPTIWAAKWNIESSSTTQKSELSDEGAAQGANDPSCTITVFY